MTPLLLPISVFALVGVAPIVLAFCAKRFGMSNYAFSYWVLLGVIFCGLTVTSTGCNMKLGGSSSTKTVLVYEVILPDELLGDENADPEKTAQEYVSSKMKQIAFTLERRIDPKRTKDVSVRQCDSNKIEIVFLENDPAEIARIKKLIPLSGTLEFRLLASNDYPEDSQLIELAGKSDDSVIQGSDGVLGMWIPITEGRENEFDFGNIVTRTRTVNDAEIKEVLCIKDKYNASGLYLNEASVGTDSIGGYCVNLRFNKEGANRFGQLTEENTPDLQHGHYRHLGIVLNGELYSAPRIVARVSDRAEISGNFTESDARTLADALNSGALPVKLSKEPVSETTNPAYGADATVELRFQSPTKAPPVE